jgi:hypothetical protein
LARYQRTANRPIDAARLDVTELNSPDRPAPIDPNGTIDAAINPLTAYSGGRAFVDGTTLGAETAHAITLGRYVVAAISPRAVVSSPRIGESVSSLTMHTGGVSFLFGDFSVEAARDYVVFGQAPTGGLLLSDNAPPLDMVRIWNDRPWRVPGFSRVFGDLRGTLFVADLGGARQIHPHTKLIGWHLTGLPHPQFEIGVQVVDAMGGRGGQPASFGDRVLDAIPVIDAFRTGGDFQFSNKLAGVDFHWRMPRWRGFELYLEANADDVDGRRLRSSFLEDGGYLGGAALSCVFACGRVGVRAEYHQTGIRYYTHTDYPMTRSGFLLGDPLGPRGNGGYLTVDGDMGKAGRLMVQGAFEARSGNQYGSISDNAHDDGFRFALLTRRPSEKRSRLLASWSGKEDSRLTVRVTAGAERVSDFTFVAGQDRTNWLARIGVVGRP